VSYAERLERLGRITYRGYQIRSASMVGIWIEHSGHIIQRSCDSVGHAKEVIDSLID
jgi:hypothetical protein